jgi:hypothetical protein
MKTLLDMFILTSSRAQVVSRFLFIYILQWLTDTAEMPVQLTFDGGNETGLMKALQQELR